MNLSHDPSFRRWNTVVWPCIALFSATQTVFVMQAEGMHHAWAALFALGCLTWLPWLLATPLIVALGERFPIEHRTPATLALHLAACAALDVAVGAWVATLEVLLEPWAPASVSGPWPPLALDRIESHVLESLFLYAAVLGVGHIVRAQRRLTQQQVDAARLSEALVRAQLDALRRQIEPHFLFNALNSAVALIREQRPDTAVATLVALGDVLRKLTQDGARQETTLAEELDLLRCYVDVQKLRFADRLNVEIDVPAPLLGARVPSLLLQPLVENAIKHGIARRAAPGRVRVAASEHAGHLALTVYNDGPALAATPAGNGVGLGNVRTRLRYLYGDAAALDLHDAAHGVEVCVRLPHRAA